MSEDNDAITEHEDGNDEAIQNNSDNSVDVSENLECAEECKTETSDATDEITSDAASASSSDDEVSDNCIDDDFIKLGATLDHDALNDMAQKILEHFKDNDSLEIDASRLEEANTACIQAFVSMNRYAQANNKTLKWLSPSESFVESFNTLGLYSEMMQMEMA